MAECYTLRIILNSVLLFFFLISVTITSYRKNNWVHDLFCLLKGDREEIYLKLLPGSSQFLFPVIYWQVESHSLRSGARMVCQTIGAALCFIPHPLKQPSGRLEPGEGGGLSVPGTVLINPIHCQVQFFNELIHYWE